MPGFDFATGNARKLFSLPLYALGAVASLVVPRRGDSWVFGSGPGIGEGALALYRFVATQHPELRLTWLAKDDADVATAEGLGITAVRKGSAAGLLRTLRARVIVVTHGFGDVNRYGTRGGFVVQLWHGLPLKLIQLDSPATMEIGVPGGWRLRGILRRFYRRGFSAIRMMPAASEPVAARLRTAFGLSDQVVATGDPRDDVLATTTPTIARNAVLALLGIRDESQRLVLFAPTWRDGEPDPDAPSVAEWAAIANWLQSSNSFLVIRPHPLGAGDYAPGLDVSPRIGMLGSAVQTDVTPLLPAFAALITDYSSIAFDFSLTGGPVFFLAPDEESYTTSRGLYEPYRRFSGGREVRSWAAILDQLRRYDTDPEWATAIIDHSASLAARHFAFTDGGNTTRVFAEIAARTGG